MKITELERQLRNLRAAHEQLAHESGQAIQALEAEVDALRRRIADLEAAIESAGQRRGSKAR